MADERIVKVEDLAVDMVYLDDRDEPMLIEDVGENVQQNVGCLTYFVAGRGLRDPQRTATFHAIGKETEFRVVDSKIAVFDACSEQFTEVRLCEATLKALPSSDKPSRTDWTARKKRAEDALRRLDPIAKRLGVRRRRA